MKALVVVLVTANALTAWGDPGTAAAKVEEGLRRFAASRYDEAAQAFAEAETALPEEPRIAFDRGCALAAQGQFDAAIDPLQKAALARAPDLAARARFNLGATELAAARQTFGEKPEDAGPEARRTGLERLGRAILHFRDLLRQPGVPAATAADARHNLELLRLWIKHMQALWEERDRQKQRQEMGLVEFLELLRRRQLELRAGVRLLEAEPDSPRRREAVSAAAKAQRRLGDEIEPLKQKLQAELQPAQGQGAVPPALAALAARADAAGKEMLDAAARLDAGGLADARGPQTQAAAILEEILVAVVTFPELVKKGVELQQSLVGAVAPLAETPDLIRTVHFPDLAEEQGRTIGWAGALPAKAKDVKAMIAGFDPSQPAQPGGQPGQPGGPAPDPAAMKKQMEALGQAADKAVELAPRIATLSREASDALAQSDAKAALPKEEEALKLWKEIADLLPKEEQQQQQGDDRKKPEDQKRNEEKKDQKPQDEKQKNEEKQDPGKQGPDRKPALSPEEAEALLRKAREREKQHREQMKELMEAILAPGGVEKDW